MSTYGKIFIYYFIKVGGACAYKDKKHLILKSKDRKVIKISAKKHKTLKERFKKYRGDYQPREWNTRLPLGKEI
jgi:hypothetical protein